MGRASVRNLLLCLGAYFLSWWVAILVTIPFTFITNRIYYHGEFQGYVVMPLVERLPIAIVAAAVGSLVAWLADSPRPSLWTLIPAVLFFAHGLRGYHWVQPPTAGDRLGQIIGAAFPAVACLVSGFVTERRLARRNQLSH